MAPPTIYDPIGQSREITRAISSANIDLAPEDVFVIAFLVEHPSLDVDDFIDQIESELLFYHNQALYYLNKMIDKGYAVVEQGYLFPTRKSQRVMDTIYLELAKR